MGMTGLVASLVGYIILFAGTIWAETRLTTNFQSEIVFIIIAIVFSVIALVGTATERRWGWPLSLIIFSAMLGNIGIMFNAIGGSVILAFTMLVNVLVIIAALIAVETWTAEIDSAPLETYETEAAKTRRR